MRGRLERLRAAFALAERTPPTVTAEGGAAFLARALADPVPGVVTVVWHSVVMQYVEPGERARMDALIGDALARATPQAPVAHLSMEPRSRASGFDVRLRRCAGEDVLLATCQGHGPPVVWEDVVERRG